MSDGLGGVGVQRRALKQGANLGYMNDKCLQVFVEVFNG
jgi:hypothetical protein